ncbi:hypothetical protein F2Q69_00029304 [Brassica cretica]|uniref:Uncharacterized protein n=1 Tax=Brassica cretica TaxID=69181 RepID=A0A8S9S361_BRACR|nr:hypothetical protein F2Q69_00029304 [Brassica cretica]
MDLVGNGIAVGDNVTLKPDESVVIEERKEELAEGVDDFQSLTDEEAVKTDEDMRGVAEGEEELGGNGNQDVQAGGEEKKKGVRKILFKKPPGIAVGTSKMRLVQAVLSPRKNGASKSSKRQGGGGEGSKQAEDKGIGELLVMQWFTLRNKEKRCRLGLHRISQRFFRHNGVCGYQVWSLVSSNHGQTTRLLYRRGFGNLASEVLKNPRRSEALAVDSFSLSRVAFLLFLPLPRAVSLPSLSSPRLLLSSLSSPRAAASGGGGRVASRISTLTSLASHLRSKSMLRSVVVIES